MAPVHRLPSTLRASRGQALRRSFHSSSTARASIFYALSALSNSRETQHFAKITKLPRVEHSTPLKLIKITEVDPHPCPTPSKPLPKPWVRQASSTKSAAQVWDKRALQVGRVYLVNQARHTHRLLKIAARARRKAAMQAALLKRSRVEWRKERQKMQNDMRSAGVWILLSIGTATALATWRFWPESIASRDSGDLGRRIAARAAAAMPLPAASSASSRQSQSQTVDPVTPAPTLLKVPRGSKATLPATAAARKSSIRIEKAPVASSAKSAPSQSWWKGLFWKQQ